MVNHVRTRLLNLPPLAVAPGPGEEYVPTGFAPVTLTGGLAAARGLLLGPGADRTGANLNLARLLAFGHASELAADFLLEDPRLTYDPEEPAGDLWSDGLGAVATTHSGSAPAGWDGAFSFASPTRGYGRWLVTAAGDGTGTVVPDSGPVWSGSARSVTGGDAFPLAGSRLSLVAARAAGSWEVTLTAPPAYRFEEAGLAEAPAGVFRPAGSGGDERWWGVWLRPHAPAALKAVALALALARRLDELAA